MEMFNNLAIIRVRYRHNNNTQPHAVYESLRRIGVCPPRMHIEERGNRHTIRMTALEADEERVAYTLVAVVRCRSHDPDEIEEADRVRLYNIFGQHQSFPTDLHGYFGTQ